MKYLTGIFPALFTPFRNNQVDEQALRKLVELNIKKGINGFYVCGSSGEAFLLTIAERKKILEIVSDQVKERVFIIAHIGAISTDFTIDLGRHAISVKGVNAVSSIPPFYYQFSRDEIISYYLDLAQELSFPVIPYNFPKLSGFTLTPDIIKVLRKNSNIIGVKFTSNNFFDLERIRKNDPQLILYNGFDEIYLAGLAMGVDGAIGSTFNFMAEKFIAITHFFKEGDMDRAQALQSNVNDIIDALLKTRCFMAAQKYMLDLIGIPFGEPRKPFKPLVSEEKTLLSKVAKKYLKLEQ